MFKVQGVKSSTSILAGVLILCMVLTGCSAAWVQTALNDLPVLIQMATSIASLVAVVKTAQPPSQQELYAIQNIGNVGTNGLKAILALYQSYKSANATTTIADIEAACTALNSNLQQLLAAAQIKDPALLARVTAAVTLITSTVNTFVALIPGTPVKMSRAAKASLKARAAGVPTPDGLRQMWLQQVGFPLSK